MEQLNQSKKWIAFIELFTSIILFVVVSTFGIIYAIFIHPFKQRRGINQIFNYFKNFFYSIWFIITHLLHTIAFTIDVLGNVINGDMIESIVTNKEYLKYHPNTWFANKDHSLSQAMGYIENCDEFKPIGNKFKNIINKIFGDNHCINAYINKIDNYDKKRTKTDN